MSYMRTEPFNYLVDSKARTGGTTDNFTTVIDLPIDQAHPYDRVAVTQILIPLTYYMISDNEGTFELIEDAVTTVLSIPEGNYTEAGLVAELQAAFDTTATNTYTVSLQNPNTQAYDGRLRISWVGPSTNVSINALSVKFAEITGLILGNNVIPTNFVSPNAINLVSEQSLFLLSNMSADGRPIGVFLDLGIGGGTVSWSSKDNISDSHPIRAVQGNAFNFRLVNEDGAQINLHGANMTFNLVIFGLFIPPDPRIQPSNQRIIIDMLRKVLAVPAKPKRTTAQP